MRFLFLIHLARPCLHFPNSSVLTASQAENAASFCHLTTDFVHLTVLRTIFFLPSEYVLVALVTLECFAASIILAQIICLTELKIRRRLR